MPGFICFCFPDTIVSRIVQDVLFIILYYIYKNNSDTGLKNRPFKTWAVDLVPKCDTANF